MDDDKLYIPYGLSIDQEYFPGFGGRELRQFFVGILGSGIIGALLLIFTGQLLAMIVALMIGAAGTMMAVRKDPYTRIITSWYSMLPDRLSPDFLTRISVSLPCIRLL